MSIVIKKKPGTFDNFLSFICEEYILIIVIWHKLNQKFDTGARVSNITVNLYFKFLNEKIYIMLFYRSQIVVIITPIALTLLETLFCHKVWLYH